MGDVPIVINYKRESGGENGGDRRLPLTVWQAAMEATIKFGPWTVLAAFLIWFITSGISATMTDIQKDVRGHISETRTYLSAICIMTAYQTGEPTELCRPTNERDHER